MRFTVHDFPDRAEWLKWRQRGIGSSDASVIMGVSRFKTVKQLLLEKAGPPQPENEDNKYIKERGNRIEGLVRDFIERQQGYAMAALNTQSVNFPYIRASLDACNCDRKIFGEFKLLSSQSKEKFNTNTEGYQKWLAAKKGIVPTEYIPQIAHQFFVTGYDQCIFAGILELRGQPIDGDSIAQVIVTRDDKYIKNLIDKEHEFWYALDSMAYKGELE